MPRVHHIPFKQLELVRLFLRLTQKEFTEKLGMHYVYYTQSRTKGWVTEQTMLKAHLLMKSTKPRKRALSEVIYHDAGYPLGDSSGLEAELATMSGLTETVDKSLGLNNEC